MNNNKNILVVVPYSLSYSFHGNSIRVKNMINGLRSKGVNVNTIEYDLPWIRNIAKEYRVKNDIVFLSALSKIVFGFSFYDYYCMISDPVKNFSRKIFRDISNKNINVLQIENLWPLPSIADNLEKNKPVIITLHDVYSDRYREVIDYTSRTPRFLKEKIINKIKEIEAHYLNKANVIVTLTKEDRERYIELGVEPDKMIVIPNGINLQEIKPIEANPKIQKEYRDSENEVILFFAGSLMYQNKKAIDDVAKYILPKLVKKIKVKMLVAGTISKYVVRRKYHRKMPIFPLGYVDNINDFYSIADIILIPTFLGTGFKTKTLEAMAAGKVVVTNSKSSRGIEARNWRDIIICEDFDCMVDSIIVLKEDKDLALKIEKNARRIAEKYDWSSILDKYIRIYEILN